MTTAALGIAQAVMAALGGLAGGRVYLNRLRPLPVGADTAVVVRLISSQGRGDTMGWLLWDTVIDVECIARSAAGAEPAVAADTLLADAWAAISGINVTDIAARSLALDPAIAWQFDADEGPVVSANISVRVTHRTLYRSLLPA